MLSQAIQIGTAFQIKNIGEHGLPSPLPLLLLPDLKLTQVEDTDHTQTSTRQAQH